MILRYSGSFFVKFFVFHWCPLLCGMDRTRNKMADRIMRSRFNPDAEIHDWGITVKELVHQLRHGGEQADDFLEGMANMAAARIRLILPKDAVHKAESAPVNPAIVRKKPKKSKNMELF